MAGIQLERIVKQIQSVLDKKQVIDAGPFLYVIIQEGAPDCQYLSRLAVFHCSLQHCTAVCCIVSAGPPP